MGFIIKPLVTEKMTNITEKKANRYGFVVRPEANKLQIKKEVEGLYNVTVEDVNTLRQRRLCLQKAHHLQPYGHFWFPS